MFLISDPFRYSLVLEVYLITVGVISAQKKMLRLLTAWEENIPMMEKAMEKSLFSVSDLSANKAGNTHTQKSFTQHTVEVVTG